MCCAHRSPSHTTRWGELPLVK
ncbi:DUF4113 domain-containing protein [Salinicola tamaricis]